MLPRRAASLTGAPRVQPQAAPESFDQALSFTDSSPQPSHQMPATNPDPAAAQSGDAASLMAAIRGGSESALGRLMDLYYLYRIVRHLVIDQKRKRAVRRRWLDRQGREDATRGGHTATPSEVLEAKLLAGKFLAAVATLPDRRREVFELVFQRGLSHAEAATVMNVSAQTVANQMSSALRTVRQAVASAGD